MVLELTEKIKEGPFYDLAEALRAAFQLRYTKMVESGTTTVIKLDGVRSRQDVKLYVEKGDSGRLLAIVKEKTQETNQAVLNLFKCKEVQ